MIRYYTCMMVLFIMIGITSCSVPAVEHFEIVKQEDGEQGRTKIIRFWMRGSDNNELAESFKSDVSAYEKDHPGIKIKYTFVERWDVETKLNTAFAGGTAPDLFEIGIINLASRANLKQFAALDEFIETWPERKEIPESVYRLGRFNNQIYGLGYMHSPFILVYRKDYFEEAGLDPNRAPGNWEQFLEYASKLTRMKNGHLDRGGFVIPKQAGEFWLEIFGRQNGSTIVDEANENPTFDEPSVAEAMEFLLKMLPYSATYDLLRGESDPFLEGKAAMTYINPESINEMIKLNPSLKDKIGAVGDIPGKQHSTFNGLRLYSIASTSKLKNEAWDVIQYFMSKERMRKRMEATSVPGTRQSLVQEYMNLNPSLNIAIMDAVKIGVGRPNVTWSPLYEKYARKGYEEAIFRLKTPSQALHDAVNALKKEIGRE